MDHERAFFKKDSVPVAFERSIPIQNIWANTLIHRGNMDISLKAKRVLNQQSKYKSVKS